MIIRAAVAHGPGLPLDIEAVDLGQPAGHELLVRLVACGVCHTDIIIREGWYPTPMPVVLGHEGVGVVEQVGTDVVDFVIGDHVVLTFNSCGRCGECRRGAPAYCDQFWEYNFAARRADGSTALSQDEQPIGSHFFGQSSFAEYCLASDRNAVKVDKSVPLAVLAPLGCGVQTGAGAVLNALPVRAGDTLAVFGAGAVGLSAVMAARLVGCAKIIVVDLVPARLELAIELGATDVVESDDDVSRRVRTLSGGGVHIAIEATGSPSVLRQATETLAVGGTCGLVGAARTGATAEIDVSTLLFGRQIMGIVEGNSVPSRFIPTLIELWKQNRFPFDRLQTCFAFDDINLAIASSEAGESIKPVIML
jgi:aryl-alcohol dehydrogenase